MVAYCTYIVVSAPIPQVEQELVVDLQEESTKPLVGIEEAVCYQICILGNKPSERESFNATCVTRMSYKNVHTKYVNTMTINFTYNLIQVKSYRGK